MSHRFSISILTVAAFLVVLPLMNPVTCPALTLSGYNQIGANGSTGKGGTGGLGGLGGDGGEYDLEQKRDENGNVIIDDWGGQVAAAEYTEESLDKSKGKTGGNGKRGGNAGTGGAGGSSKLIISDHFLNQGRIELGGKSGGQGSAGLSGQASGGAGGKGGAFQEISADGDPPVLFWIEHWAQSGAGPGGGAGHLFHRNGYDGSSGGGGGGGTAGHLFYWSGFKGGKGGVGKTGDMGDGGDGFSGLPQAVSYFSSVENLGTFQVGGDGGNGGQGGQGGSGGGGGGGAGGGLWAGYHYFLRILGDGFTGGQGGKPGPGGRGGSGGMGGDGILSIGNGGLLTNDTSGTIQIGRGPAKASGILNIESGGKLANYGKIDVTNGNIATESGASVVNSGTITIPEFSNYGALGGSGVFNGNLNNYADFFPGDSTGNMTINGNYTENGFLEIELAGVADYDSVSVFGDVQLGDQSMLDLDFFGTFDESQLNDGDGFDFLRYTGMLTGLFGAVDDSDALLSKGYWNLDYGYDLGNGWQSARLIYAGYESPVPEPTTILLVVIGLIGLSAVSQKNTINFSSRAHIQDNR